MNAPTFSSVFIAFDEVEHFASGGVLRLGDIMVLLYIDAHNACHAAAIAEALGSLQPKVSRSLKRLSTAELVEESISQADRRILRYKLSNRGEHVVFEIKKKFGAQKIMQCLREYRALQHAVRETEQALGVAHLSESAQRILLVLYDAGLSQAGCSQTEICQALHLAQNRVSAALDAMQKNGFIVKGQVPHDRRIVQILLTEQGKQTASYLQQAYMRSL